MQEIRLVGFWNYTRACMLCVTTDLRGINNHSLVVVLLIRTMAQVRLVICVNRDVTYVHQ